MLANHSDIFLTVEQAEEELGVPVLGMIPEISEEKLRLLSHAGVFSPVMEAFRSLRTGVYFATLDRPCKTLVVTSALPGEGKSTVTADLSIALAMDGKKVIMVDSDLRRPTLHKYLETTPWPGLTDVLTGTHTMDEALRDTGTPGLHFLPVGPPPPNPAELLGSPQMTRVLEELSARCDLIVLDSAPTLLVADGLVLAHRADAVLMVISEETLKRNVERAMKLLSRARANVIGTAFNRLVGRYSGYFYGKYYVPSESLDDASAESPAENDE